MTNIHRHDTAKIDLHCKVVMWRPVVIRHEETPALFDEDMFEQLIYSSFDKPLIPYTKRISSGKILAWYDWILPHVVVSHTTPFQVIFKKDYQW